MDLVVDNNKRMIRFDNKYHKSIINLLYSYGIIISSEKWRSQFNTYVEYDCEPWVSAGFDCEMYFNNEPEGVFDFAAFLITRHLERIELFERMYAEV